MTRFFDRTADNFGIFIINRLNDSGVSTENVDSSEIAGWYREFLNDNIPEEIKLATLSPDFEQVYSALQLLVTENESWQEIATSGTGAMMLSLIAAVAVYNQTAIIRGTHESTLDTSRIDHSIYAQTRMLGVDIVRKTPSKILVSLTNSNPEEEQIIQPLTRWTIGRTIFFNRDLIVFRQGETIIENIQLYEGNVVEDRFEGTGNPYQRYEVGIPDFSTSNEDIAVFVNNTEWELTERGIWSHGQENIFQEGTTASGTVEINFGSGINGNIPASGSEVRIVYARTDGTVGAFHKANEDVISQDNSNITGVTTGNSTSGGDEIQPEFYRRNAPHIHAGINKAVTQDQYRSIIKTFPGIIDAEVRGQQHINPDDPKLFNRVLVTALRSNGVPWTESEWQDFVIWLEERSLIGVHLVRIDPLPIIVDVEVEVFCLRSADLQATRLTLINHLESTFAIRSGSLGRDLYLNDIHKALRNEPNTRELITHLVLKTPFNDITVDQSGFVRLRNINLTTTYSDRLDIS